MADANRCAVIATRSTLLALMACTPVLVGCTPPAASELEGPWAQEFEQALDSVSSDFQREVLSDGEVTPAEYAEAQQRFRECAAASGLDVKTHQEGGFSFSHPNQQEGESIAESCSLKTLNYVEALYLDPLANPENVPWDEAYLRCLQASGVVEESMTAEDMANWEWDYDDPAQRACSEDPLGSDSAATG
ncbi:hypothetical protein GCM10022377_21570 [Zhihengliuella alba]|uniref:Lipoprotein n=1 Tax=Zhihengliuella alba TaxID=547018 RepID=A0ABP7DMQ8_9MICC